MTVIQRNGSSLLIDVTVIPTRDKILRWVNNLRILITNKRTAYTPDNVERVRQSIWLYLVL